MSRFLRMFLTLVLAFTVTVFAKDAICDEKCIKEAVDICTVGKDINKKKYVATSEFLVDNLGPAYATIPSYSEEAMGLCVLILWYDNISKESYAKHIKPVIKHLTKPSKESELEKYMVDLVTHMYENSDIPSVEESIIWTTRNYNGEYDRIYKAALSLKQDAMIRQEMNKYKNLLK